MHVLIIEDEIPLATQIGDTIEAAGDEPDFADEAALAIRLCQMNRYDVIIFNSSLPRCGPIPFCQKLISAAGRRTPILALGETWDSQPESHEDGPKACLPRPVDMAELRNTLKALVAERSDGMSQLVAGELHMDLEHHSVYCGQVPVQLAPISFRILELLIRAFPGVVTRAQIEKQIWDGNPPESDAALRGHIHRLRQLLERPMARKMIRTVHGVGYQLEENAR